MDENLNSQPFPSASQRIFYIKKKFSHFEIKIDGMLRLPMALNSEKAQ